MSPRTTGIINKKNASKILGIQFSILSPEEIRNGSVAEITSRDTYVNNKPVINGLFDPRMGVLEPGFICPQMVLIICRHLDISDTLNSRDLSFIFNI